MKIEKFMIFGFNAYGACGGMEDFLFQARTIEKAMKKIDDDFENRRTGGFEFYQILDTETLKFKEIKMPERKIVNEKSI